MRNGKPGHNLLKFTNRFSSGAANFAIRRSVTPAPFDGEWLDHCFTEGIDEAQAFALQPLRTYNKKRHNVGIGGLGESYH